MLRLLGTDGSGSRTYEVLLQKNCEFPVLFIFLLQLEQKKLYNNMIPKLTDAEHELWFKLAFLWEYFSLDDVQKEHN